MGLYWAGVNLGVQRQDVVLRDKDLPRLAAAWVVALSPLSPDHWQPGHIHVLQGTTRS